MHFIRTIFSSRSSWFPNWLWDICNSFFLFLYAYALQLTNRAEEIKNHQSGTIKPICNAHRLFPSEHRNPRPCLDDSQGRKDLKAQKNINIILKGCNSYCLIYMWTKHLVLSFWPLSHMIVPFFPSFLPSFHPFLHHLLFILNILSYCNLSKLKECRNNSRTEHMSIISHGQFTSVPVHSAFFFSKRSTQVNKAKLRTG